MLEYFWELLPTIHLLTPKGPFVALHERGWGHMNFNIDIHNKWKSAW